MKSHRAESDPRRARGLSVSAREVGHLREAVGQGKTDGGGLVARALRGELVRLAPRHDPLVLRDADVVGRRAQRARAPDGDELDHSGFSFRLRLVGILSFDGFLRRRFVLSGGGGERRR